MHKYLMALFLGLAGAYAFTAFGADKPAAHKDASEEQMVESVQCKKGQDSRKLEVQTKGAGCVLLYTKAGKANEIARSQRGVDLCKENLQKVRKNLEKASYQCE